MSSLSKNALYSPGLKLTLVLTEKAVQVCTHTHSQVIWNHYRKIKNNKKMYVPLFHIY